MALNEVQQLKNLLESNKHILLVLNSVQNTDAICAAVAWKKWLEKQHKQVDIIADNFILPKNLTQYQIAGQWSSGLQVLSLIKSKLKNQKSK